MPNNCITKNIFTHMTLKARIDLVGSNGITQKRPPKIKRAADSQLPSGFCFFEAAPLNFMD